MFNHEKRQAFSNNYPQIPKYKTFIALNHSGIHHCQANESPLIFRRIHSITTDIPYVSMRIVISTRAWSRFTTTTITMCFNSSYLALYMHLDMQRTQFLTINSTRKLQKILTTTKSPDTPPGEPKLASVLIPNNMLQISHQ